jgi:UTP--glucose-1-phosphate uridylyltransferase
MKKLRKAIFPVAGLGTRFLPATKAIPKEMLTVVDRPLIQYAVDEAVEAGIEVLIFVTGRSKRAISDHFDRNFELEAELKAKGNEEALQIVRNVLPDHVKCIFVYQHQPLGLGHAVLCAKEMIDDEPFAVILPDDLIDGIGTGALSQMAAVHRLTGESVLAVEQVPHADVKRYGVIKPGESFVNRIRVDGIVEKPEPKDAPSNLCVVGRYILTPDVMDALTTQTPGKGGEIQLTDSIARCLPSGQFSALQFAGRRFDCGNKRGFLEANVHFGIKNLE